MLSFSPHLDTQLPGFFSPPPLFLIVRFSLLSDSQIYEEDLPLSTLPPQGESLACYKLSGREHYKLNIKLPKEDTPSEQGTERTQSRELSHTPNTSQAKGVMQPEPFSAPSASPSCPRAAPVAGQAWAPVHVEGFV